MRRSDLVHFLPPSADDESPALRPWTWLVARTCGHLVPIQPETRVTSGQQPVVGRRGREPLGFKATGVSSGVRRLAQLTASIVSLHSPEVSLDEVEFIYCFG